MAADWRSYKPKLIPDIPDLHKIDVYIKNGGYEALKKVRRWVKEHPVAVQVAGLKWYA